MRYFPTTTTTTRKTRIAFILLLLAVIAISGVAAAATKEVEEFPPCRISEDGSYQLPPLEEDLSNDNSNLPNLSTTVDFTLQLEEAYDNHDDANHNDLDHLSQIAMATWSEILLRPMLPYFFATCRTAQELTWPADAWEYFPRLSYIHLEMHYLEEEDDNDASSPYVYWQGRMTAVQVQVVNPVERPLAEQHLQMALTRTLQDAVQWWEAAAPTPDKNASPSNHDFSDNMKARCPVQSMTLLMGQNNGMIRQHEEQSHQTKGQEMANSKTMIALIMGAVVMAVGAVYYSYTASSSSSSSSFFCRQGRRRQPYTNKKRNLLPMKEEEDTEHSESSSSWDDGCEVNCQELVEVRRVTEQDSAAALVESTTTALGNV